LSGDIDKVELECIRKQILASRKIGAPRREIDYLEKEDGRHYLKKHDW